MTIFVDSAFIPADVPNGRVTHSSKWCHLMSDNIDKTELHAFAARLGLRRSYFQHETKYPEMPWLWHYDVTLGKRAQAVRLGAVEIDLDGYQAIVAEQQRQMGLR